MRARDLLHTLMQLHRQYARTPRLTITAERWECGAQTRSSDIDVEQLFLREPLLEHVGHLPVVASTLHPYIDHRDAVELGRVLQMLAIHDIGETVTGDQLAYAKTQTHADAEYAAARSIIPDEQWPLYEEFEARETYDAQFAKAVDSLAPFLHELDVPEWLQRKRFTQLGFGARDIAEKKREHFAWDGVLLELFEECMAAFHAIERGEATGLRITSE